MQMCLDSGQIVKILPKGLITIPAEKRRKLGFMENGLAKISEEDGKLILEPIFTLSYPVRSYTDSEIKEFLEEDKKESKVLKKKKLL